MTNEMKASEVLSKARDVLAELGWHQGDFRDRESGAVCLIGALNLVAPGWFNDAVTPLRDAMGVTYDIQISVWNDDPSRTYEDVVLALKRAEELAVERGL